MAVIPVYGVIEHRADWLTAALGGTSVEGLRGQLREAVNEPSVLAVVLDVDSPGGTVAGVTELAAEIRAMRGAGKPIVAVANSLAASAAYWLAAQADQVVATPSGSVGAIGIYAVHQEASRMLDKMGVTTTIISAGPHKTEANEFEPLSDEARADLQDRVDASYRLFLADVAAGRRLELADVEERFGGGRVVPARKALAAGMVDRVETLAETIARLGTTGGRRRALAAYSPELIVAEAEPVELDAKAIGPHKAGVSDDPWDGPANEARLPTGEGAEAALRKAHAWIDPEGDPTTKAAYKFIHHEVGADGSVGAANMRACSSTIAILNGGRGGTNIPSEDKAGVHRHVGAHLSDGDRAVPPLIGEMSLADQLADVAAEAAELVAAVERRAEVRSVEGQPPISSVTTEALRATRDAINALLSPGDPAVAAQPPAEPGAPAPVAQATPPQAALPPRFRSREDWLRYLEARS